MHRDIDEINEEMIGKAVIACRTPVEVRPFFEMPT
jgi:hypothetical protein